MSNDTRPCYYPDHTEATADVPCTGDKYTSCCLKSDICLSNGFCIAITTQPFVVTRGSCTNQGWDSGCPTHCAENSDNPSNGFGLSILKIQNGKTEYCCGMPANDSNGNDVCPNNEPSFTLDAAHAVPGRALLSNLSNFYVSGSVPSSPASPSLLPNSTTSTSTGNNGTNHDVAIGIGVGIPLGAIALVSLAWAFFERRQARTSNAKLAAVISGELQHIPPTNGYKTSRQNNNMAVELGAMHTMPAELEQTHSVPELMGRVR